MCAMDLSLLLMLAGSVAVILVFLLCLTACVYNILVEDKDTSSIPWM